MTSDSWKNSARRWVGSLLLALVLPAALANPEAVRLDRAPIDPSDMASLQRGAQHFMNYCLTCHSAQFARFDLLQRLGLTEGQVKKNLILTDAKIADYMTVALKPKDAKNWFGVPPPDLSVEARVRGANWLYTYLRSFYRDEHRDSGWNNLVFRGVAMPNVLWELQGEQVLQPAEGAKPGELHGGKLVLAKPGKLAPKEYDQFVADLVNYMVFMAEPARQTRFHIGYGVMIFLAIAFVITRALKKEYWKDVH
ncbi:MAG: cytochrome c1 [Betaproteobacteria bacterium]|nr:cytochrome c1 [Betaproteobacteria bacterium]MDE2621813.1 cytochrome c1 [Betaproteobacteria bacterium]